MNIKKSVRHEDGILIETDTGHIHVQALGDAAWRVRYTQEDAFSRKPSLMVESPPPPSDIAIEESADKLELSTGKVKLEIGKCRGGFTWRDADGGLLTRHPWRDGMSLVPTEVKRAILGETRVEEGVDGQRVKFDEVRWETARSAWHAKLRFEFQPGEAVYGLGQHDQGVMNYRGSNEFLFQQNMKVAMPMFISTRGWGVLMDSYSLGSFRDDGHGSYYWCDVEDELEFYFMYGPSFDDIMSRCRALTGKATMLPRWAFGYIQSKERYKTQAELLEVAAEYRRRGLPLDVIVQDWHTWPEGMWGEKQFDPSRFPDPDRLVTELHDRNVKLMVSIWPIISGGPNAAEMAEKGFMLGETSVGTGSVYDAFDPEARALYWKQAYEGYYRYGIDAWWCDCTEPFEADWNGREKREPWEQMLTDTEEFKKFIDPEYINAYSLQHSRGLYEHQLKESPDKRMVNLTRSAYVGQQRYGTITWSGDVAARWDVLAAQIPAGLNFCMTGSPWWSTDVGAFFVNDRPELWFTRGDFNGGVDNPGYRELYVRWFQYGVFLPILRSHGTETPREVWRFGEPGTPFHDALVRCLQLRYRLLPYIYSLAGWTYHRDYTPMRALAFDFPEEEALHDVKDQFMFGPALMACPVTTPMYYGSDTRPLEGMSRTRRVILPAGCDWYDFWTGARHAGGQTIEAEAPLETIPLFVRAGSMLPLGPVSQYADEKLDAPWEVRVYPGRDGNFEVYEDRGEGLEYLEGACAWTPMTWDDAAGRLCVGQRSGSFDGMIAERGIRLAAGAAGLAEQGGEPRIYRGETLHID
jgi:alpha-D-xyloside xylohydrolase